MQARHSRPSCATSVFVVPHFTVGYFPELTCRNLLSFMNVEEVLSYSLSYDNVDATWCDVTSGRTVSSDDLLCSFDADAMLVGSFVDQSVAW